MVERDQREMGVTEGKAIGWTGKAIGWTGKVPRLQVMRSS